MSGGSIMATYTKGTIQNGTPIIGNVDAVDFFDIKQFMSQRGADLLFGQGFTITSDKDEITKFLNDIKEMNQLDDLMLQVAKDTNYYGRTILTIDKTKTNDFIISFANNELFQNVAKFEITPFYARLLKRKVIGVQVFYINEEWTTTKVKRSLSIEGEKGEVRAITATDNIPKELEIPVEEVHNLGFVPFVEITNKPSRNMLLTSAAFSTRLQDDYSVSYMATHINNGLRQWYKEETIGGVRVFGNFTEQQLAKLKAQGGNIALDTYIIGTNPSPNQSKPVEIQPATFVDTVWSGSMKVKCNLYAIGCGYSPIFPEVADPTEAESLLSRDADQRTTKAKRRRYQLILTDLLAKLLVYKGMAKDLQSAKELFSVEIKENVIYNRLQLADFLIKKVQGRLMTQAEAINLDRDLDNMEQAEQIVKQINDEYMQDQEAQMALLDTPEQQGMDAMGSNGDSQPVKE